MDCFMHAFRVNRRLSLNSPNVSFSFSLGNKAHIPTFSATRSSKEVRWKKVDSCDLVRASKVSRGSKWVGLEAVSPSEALIS